MSIVECTEVILDAGDVNVPRERARRLWLSPRMNFNPLSIQTKHQNCYGKTIRFAIEMLCSGIWICNLLSFHLFLLNKQTYNCTSNENSNLHQIKITQIDVVCQLIKVFTHTLRLLFDGLFLYGSRSRDLFGFQIQIKGGWITQRVQIHGIDYEEVLRLCFAHR